MHASRSISSISNDHSSVQFVSLFCRSVKSIVKMSLVLIVLIAVCSTLIAAFRWKHRRFYELAAKIPEIEGWPIVGVTHKFFRAKPEEFLPIMLRMVREDMKIGSVWFGSKFAVIANTPEQFQEVFTSPHCANKPKLIFDGFFAESSSFCINNMMHKARRKLLNPSFSTIMLNRVNTSTNVAIKGFMARMDEKCGNGTFDVYHHIAACALRSTMLGHFEFADDSHDYKVVDAFER
jgi:cytochrome P450